MAIQVTKRTQRDPGEPKIISPFQSEMVMMHRQVRHLKKQCQQPELRNCRSWRHPKKMKTDGSHEFGDYRTRRIKPRSNYRGAIHKSLSERNHDTNSPARIRNNNSASLKSSSSSISTASSLLISYILGRSPILLPPAAVNEFLEKR